MGKIWSVRWGNPVNSHGSQSEALLSRKSTPHTRGASERPILCYSRLIRAYLVHRSNFRASGLHRAHCRLYLITASVRNKSLEVGRSSVMPQKAAALRRQHLAGRSASPGSPWRNATITHGLNRAWQKVASPRQRPGPPRLGRMPLLAMREQTRRNGARQAQ